VFIQPRKPPYPGLHQKKCGQQVKGSDFAPLLWSGKTPPGVLCPGLELPEQERQQSVRLGPEEGDEDDLRAGTPLLL